MSKGGLIDFNLAFFQCSHAAECRTTQLRGRPPPLHSCVLAFDKAPS